MALNGLFCADVPLRNYSLTHAFDYRDKNLSIFIHLTPSCCIELYSDVFVRIFHGCDKCFGLSGWICVIPATEVFRHFSRPVGVTSKWGMHENPRLHFGTANVVGSKHGAIYTEHPIQFLLLDVEWKPQSEGRMKWIIAQLTFTWGFVTWLSHSASSPAQTHANTPFQRCSPALSRLNDGR